MIEVKDLHKTYINGIVNKKKVHAVNGISFDIPDGSTLGIVGNSGCGKSTTARMLLSLEKPDSGSIIIDGRDILKASNKERRELTTKVQIIFQHPETSLDPMKKIKYSLNEPMAIHYNMTKAQREEKIRYYLDLVDISEKLLDRYPHQISGGEAQRIMIARVLTLEPKILILDEPTSMLDVSIQAQVLSLLKELQNTLDLSYLFISHDISVVKWFCDKIAVMNDGEFVEMGETDNILSSPKHEFTRKLLDSYRFD